MVAPSAARWTASQPARAPHFDSYASPDATTSPCPAFSRNRNFPARSSYTSNLPAISLLLWRGPLCDRHPHTGGWPRTRPGGNVRRTVTGRRPCARSARPVVGVGPPESPPFLFLLLSWADDSGRRCDRGQRDQGGRRDERRRRPGRRAVDAAGGVAGPAVPAVGDRILGWRGRRRDGRARAGARVLPRGRRPAGARR